MHRFQLIAFSLLLISINAAYSQQLSDPNFYFANDISAFEKNQGPTVCVDEAHKNFHTVSGRYLAFSNLLIADGYVVEPFNQLFSEVSLEVCDILVIANASALAPEARWPYPHDSAFTGEEIEAVMHWIRGGGNLLIFADHPPFAGGNAGLGAVLGIVMTDVFAKQDPSCIDCDFFTLEEGTLHDHAILRGRNASEAIDKVLTFDGQPAQISQYWQPLMTFGENAMASFQDRQIYQRFESEDETPQFSISGWIHAATREWDEGRIVFIGEAALCTAQTYGEDNLKFGMSLPDADQNPQFCLNTLRWLARVL